MFWRDYGAAQLFRRTSTGKREIQGTKRGNLRESAILVAKGDEFRRGQRSVGQFRLQIPEPDNLFGMIEGQRLQQHSVHNAEDCGVRADAERERENCDGRESGIFHQTTESIAQVLRETFQPTENVHVARPFFLEREIPKTFLRGFPCFTRRHSGADAVCNAPVEVIAQFFVELDVSPLSLPQSSQTSNPRHRLFPSNENRITRSAKHWRRLPSAEPSQLLLWQAACALSR